MRLSQSLKQNYSIGSSLSLLLSVIFGTQVESKIAWKNLRNEVKQDSLSSENYQVFSILVSRLSQLEIQDELIPKLKGFSRYLWVKNQTKIKTIIELIQLLQKDQINFVLIQELGLLLFFYQDSPKLPVTNLAFLVSSKNVMKTINLLKQKGWESKGFINEAIIKEFNYTRLENKKIEQDLRIIELFWRIESQNNYALVSSEDIFKQSLILTDFCHYQIKVFNSTYQLYYLLSCLGDNINITTWSINFITLLKNNPHLIDWMQLSDLLQGSNLHLSLKQFEIYNFLQFLEKFHHNDQLIKTLDNIPITLANKIEFWLRKYKNIHPILTKLDHRYKIYTQTDIYSKKISKLQGFLIYLKQEWKLNSYWELPLQMLTRSIKYLNNFAKN